MIHVTQDRREKIDGWFERSIRSLLKSAFTGSDFFTIAETAKYKPSESLDTWRQMRGERFEVVEIYNKGDWVCDVHSGMTRDQMVNKIWKILQLKIADRKRKEREKNAHTNSTTAQ